MVLHDDLGSLRSDVAVEVRQGSGQGALGSLPRGLRVLVHICDRLKVRLSPAIQTYIHNINNILAGKYYTAMLADKDD